MITGLRPRLRARINRCHPVRLLRAAQTLRAGAVWVAAGFLVIQAPRLSETSFPDQRSTVAAAAMQFACPGDCDADLAVNIDELIVGVNIALGNSGVASCPAMDTGESGSVEIDELILAVGATLDGCASASARLLQSQGYSSTEAAAILQSSGYDHMDCGMALILGFGADVWKVGADLKAAGYGCNEINHAVETLFPAVDPGQVMDDIGCDVQIVDPATPGYQQLGSGYDVFTAYADAEFVKNKILDLDALNRDAKLSQFPVDKFTVNQFQGTTISAYVSSLSISAGLSGSYNFFSGSINTTMSQMSSVTTEWSFATVQNKHRVHGLSVVKMQPDELRAYLVDDFADDINSDLDPMLLFDMYGTHVIGKLVVGGRLDYHLAALVTNQQQKQNIGVYAEAKFDSGFASIDLNTSFDYGTYRSQYVSNEDYTLSSVGGQGQASRVWTDNDYTQWVDTVSQHPLFCDFSADPWLIPIWDLANGGCAEGSRCWAIREAYKVYAQGKRIDIPQARRDVLVDMAVTTDIPSTQPGFEPLKDYTGSAARAYVNKGVSSKRTPTRQHDAIMEATKLWISYKAVGDDQAIVAPINGIHLFTGTELERELAYGTHGLLKMTIGDVEEAADLSYDTCQQPTYWHTTPCPTSLCAYDCDNVRCDLANTHRRELHYTRVSEPTPEAAIQSLVLGDAAAKDKSLDFETRKRALWWGPQDLNHDGAVDDTDVHLVLDRVVWLTNSGGQVLNVNEGAQNYHVYDYECPWGCCWVKTSITPAPQQYLGYVPYTQ